MTGRIPSWDFYRDKLADVCTRAAEVSAFQGFVDDLSPQSLSAVPVTTKQSLKARPWDYVVGGISDAIKYYETTGTTGQVTPTPRRIEDVIWNIVSVGEAWRSVLRDDDRVAVLLPSDIVPVADLVASICEYLGLTHTRMYPFAAGISDWDRLIQLWGTLRPTVVYVAPGVALQLTRLLKQRGLLGELSESVRGLMLLGEVSTPALRERLGRWWGATAYDASYGSTETGTLAATCPQGQLHLLTTANYFELADGPHVGPLPEQGTGRLVVTPLNLHARPLVRLDTGDQVEVGGGCDCGDRTPVVIVDGRASEALRVRDAELTVRAVENVVYGATTATGYLLEVDAAGDYARLLLERDRDTDRVDEDVALETVRQRSAAELGLSWDAVVFVNALPVTTKSGGSQKSWKRSNIRLVDSQVV